MEQIFQSMRSGRVASSTSMFNAHHRIMRTSETTRLTATKTPKPEHRGNPLALQEQSPSLRFRAILAPVDFSQRSLKALDFAVSLARLSTQC